MHTYLLEMLECPACHGDLDWNIVARDADRIQEAAAICQACGATYPVRDDIGLFLTPDLPRNDLWEQMDSGLIQHLRQHPELERQLMEPPLESLAPADQFFRALVLEERDKYLQAQAAEEAAQKGLYTPEYLACWNKQADYIVEQLAASEGPIVDLASGRCYLVETLVHKLERPVVATDFSPRVLRRARRWLASLDLYDKVSLLAFDARRTPFKDGAVGTLTTNLGLPNVEEPGNLLGELRRVVGGTFLALMHFYPEEDEANARAIHQAGLSPLIYRRKALAAYEQAGWKVEVRNACLGRAKPTPAGVLLAGAQIDGLPVVDTDLEWCVLVAWPS